MILSVAPATGPSTGLITFQAVSLVTAMHADLELSMGQQFEIERFNRAIDATTDADQLRLLAKQLLQAWHTQKAATHWVNNQQLT